jgi:hypothetical protein
LGTARSCTALLGRSIIEEQQCNFIAGAGAGRQWSSLITKFCLALTYLWLLFKKIRRLVIGLVEAFFYAEVYFKSM